MSQGVIQGSTHDVPLADVMQLLCQAGKSGCFQIRHVDREARVDLSEGRVWHAEVGLLEGFEALMDLARWPEATYAFEEGRPAGPLTMGRPTPAVLVAFARRQEEWKLLRELVPDLELYPRAREAGDAVTACLSPQEARLLDLSTGHYSLMELASLLDEPLESIAKGFYGLVLSGAVELGAQRSGITPVVAKEPPRPVDAPEGREAPLSLALDPTHERKLRAFAQRVAAVARETLPASQGPAVARREAEALGRLDAGEGGEALKALALDLSRDAVAAGCPAERIHSLNTRLKALFTPR